MFEIQKEIKRKLKLLIAQSIGDSTFSKRGQRWKDFDGKVPLHLLRFHLEGPLPQLAGVVAEGLAFELTHGGGEFKVKSPFEVD